MTRKELQNKLQVVFDESTLGDIKIIKKELNDYELIEKSKLKYWVNKLITIREGKVDKDYFTSRDLIIDLESEILSEYR